MAPEDVQSSPSLQTTCIYVIIRACPKDVANHIGANISLEAFIAYAMSPTILSTLIE